MISKLNLTKYSTVTNNRPVCLQMLEIFLTSCSNHTDCADRLPSSMKNLLTQARLCRGSKKCDIAGNVKPGSTYLYRS